MRKSYNTRSMSRARANETSTQTALRRTVRTRLKLELMRLRPTLFCVELRILHTRLKLELMRLVLRPTLFCVELRILHTRLKLELMRLRLRLFYVNMLISNPSLVRGVTKLSNTLLSGKQKIDVQCLLSDSAQQKLML